MKDSPRQVLGTVIVVDIDPVAVEASATYDIAGVLGFGRGVFARGALTGSQTSYKTLNRLHAGQLVVSRLKAFEGAVTVVPDLFDGWYVSPEFPTFTADRSRLLPSYLAHVCRWRDFWESLRTRSKGIGARRERVGAEDVLKVEIPLPPIEEQRRISRSLSQRLEKQGALLRATSSFGPDAIRSFLPSLVEETFRKFGAMGRPLGTLCDLVADVVHPGDDLGSATTFVGLQHVEKHTGQAKGELPLGNEKGRKLRFAPGDVVYGYLRPYLNKVWVADRSGLCSVDQYVLRPHLGVSPQLLAFALRSRSTLDKAIELTHNLQLPRLRSGLLSTIDSPWVESDQIPLEEELHELSRRIIHLAALRGHQHTLLAALEPALINEALAG